MDALDKWRAQNEKLKRLVESSVTLNASLDLNEVLERILNLALEILDCEAASILLYKDAPPHLFFAAATNPSEALFQVKVPLEGSLAGHIFQSGEPLILNDVQTNARHFRLPSQKVGVEVRSLLGVPMWMRERKIGVLEALNKREGEFDSEDVVFLSVIANHAAVAIENARLYQALRHSYERLREIDRIKSDFLSLASHELRTPLGIIIGYASVLQQDAQGENSEYARQVMNAAMRLRALIEDMTNLTLLETDSMLFKPRPLQVRHLFRVVLSEVEHLCAGALPPIDEVLEDESLTIYADLEKTTLALKNVLHNAVRFSPPEKPIHLGAQAEGDFIHLWVRDEGIGLAEDQKERIFEKFYQVESPNTRTLGGMGLGLSIARQLIERQGGKIWAESPGLGQGSTFHILLPRTAAKATTGASA